MSKHTIKNRVIILSLYPNYCTYFINWGIISGNLTEFIPSLLYINQYICRNYRSKNRVIILSLYPNYHTYFMNRVKKPSYYTELSYLFHKPKYHIGNLTEFIPWILPNKSKHSIKNRGIILSLYPNYCTYFMNYI